MRLSFNQRILLILICLGALPTALAILGWGLTIRSTTPAAGPAQALEEVGATGRALLETLDSTRLDSRRARGPGGPRQPAQRRAGPVPAGRGVRPLLLRRTRAGRVPGRRGLSVRLGPPGRTSLAPAQPADRGAHRLDRPHPAAGAAAARPPAPGRPRVRGAPHRAARDGGSAGAGPHPGDRGRAAPGLPGDRPAGGARDAEPAHARSAWPWRSWAAPRRPPSARRSRCWSRSPTGWSSWPGSSPSSDDCPRGRRPPVDLGELLEELSRTSVPPTMRTRLMLDPATPVIEGHYDPLRRAFSNILRNAVEACGGQGEIEITACARGRGAPDRDSGPRPRDPARARGADLRPVLHRQGGRHRPGPRAGEADGRAPRRDASPSSRRRAAAPPSSSGSGCDDRRLGGDGPAQLLLVDDEANIRRMLGALLREEGFTVAEAPNGNAALLMLDQADPDVVLLDLLMPPGPDGLETLARIRERGRRTPVIMMSGKAQLTDAVRAVKLGAFQFLEKPLTPEAVLVTVRAALELNRTRAENRALQAELSRRGSLIGESAAMQQVRALIARVAPTEARVLVTGESGTGKEMVARGDPRGEPAGRPRVRDRQLRGHPARPGRVGDVRPRARLVHRRDRAAARPVRAGPRGHPLPRRDRRPEPRGPGQAAPDPGVRRGAADRRRGHHADRRAGHLGDQPAAGERGRRRHVPGGPLLPARGLPDPPAAAPASGWTTCPRWWRTWPSGCARARR